MHPRRFAHQQWQALGSPARERFGLTIDAGQHDVWLDEPPNEVIDL
ncbi:hypothetical protein [Saccharopolyspora hattusasensis]